MASAMAWCYIYKTYSTDNNFSSIVHHYTFSYYCYNLGLAFAFFKVFSMTYTSSLGLVPLVWWLSLAQWTCPMTDLSQWQAAWWVYSLSTNLTKIMSVQLVRTPKFVTTTSVTVLILWCVFAGFWQNLDEGQKNKGTVPKVLQKITIRHDLW